MLLLTATGLLLLTLLLYTPIVSTRQKADLTTFKMIVHEYSGLDEEEFWRFVMELQMFENTYETSVEQAAGHLYEAMNHAQNLGMLASSSHKERMDEAVRSLGVEGERILVESARRTKTPYKTIYLKDTL